MSIADLEAASIGQLHLCSYNKRVTKVRSRPDKVVAAIVVLVQPAHMQIAAPSTNQTQTHLA